MNQWNVYALEGPCTNNHAEGWHSNCGSWQEKLIQTFTKQSLCSSPGGCGCVWVGGWVGVCGWVGPGSVCKRTRICTCSCNLPETIFLRQPSNSVSSPFTHSTFLPSSFCPSPIPPCPSPIPPCPILLFFLPFPDFDHSSRSSLPPSSSSSPSSSPFQERALPGVIMSNKKEVFDKLEQLCEFGDPGYMCNCYCMSISVAVLKSG